MRYGIFPAFFLLVTMACAPADLGAQQPAKKNAEAPAEAAQTPESEERLSLETNQVLVNVTSRFLKTASRSASSASRSRRRPSPRPSSSTRAAAWGRS
jgi:hypothetical protein